MATDNTTVEACFYKGNSSSVKLYDLVVRIRELELDYGLKIFITHVSGTRMKAQGTDGLSRGNTNEGVSFGDTMLKYCPWGQSALERSPTLKAWITDWQGPSCEFLKHNDWFVRGHDHLGGYVCNEGYWRWNIKPGTFVWTPPPAAGDVMIEDLRKARMKRQDSTHVIIVPKLFTHLWKKQFLKACDMTFEIPAGHPFWSHDQFEPLTIGFCFPFLKFPPW